MAHETGASTVAWGGYWTIRAARLTKQKDEASHDQSGARHHRRERHLRSARPGERARGALGEPLGRAVQSAAQGRSRGPAGGVSVAPRAGPSAVAVRHQLPRQYRRHEARRRHRHRFAVGLRLVQGGTAARHLRAGRPVRRPHPRAAELVLRQGLRRACFDGASGLAALAHASAKPRARKASISSATAPTCAWRARNSPLTRRA